ncbi:MAG: FAD-dependent monooxygenase [Pseudomonadota bacterium]
MNTYDLLIVGCGPVGATLANYMRMKGYSVAIFDRDTEIFKAPRAMQIDAESCRIFQQIGVQSRLEGKDARPANRHIFVGENREPLMELDFSLLQSEDGYPAAGMRFHQPALERLLREDFNKTTPVDTFFGYEVTEVEGDDSVATLNAEHLETGEVTQFRGNYIVGCDGGASLCKKYIGGQRKDYNYSRRWIVMDVIVHDNDVWNALIDRSEFRCRADAAVVFVKGCNNHVRFDFEVTDDVADSFNETDARALIAEYFNPSSIEFQRIAPYHFYAGMPDKWRRGRVFIAGDAAHLTSPFSGQGLNMGIRDAANLAFKFDLVFRNLASDKLLDSYEEERWKNCEHVIKGATSRGLMISKSTFLGTLQRNFSFWLGSKMPKLALEMTRKMSDFVPYENGLIGGHILSGQQMIQPFVTDATGEKVRLDDAIGDRFGYITDKRLDTPEAEWFANTLGGIIMVMGTDLHDWDGKLTHFLETNDVSGVLIRPDRYIYDADKSSGLSIGKLKTALEAYT